MSKIAIGIAGVGNCASSLLQGLEFYRALPISKRRAPHSGLMHYDVCGYRPGDIEVVCASFRRRSAQGRPSRSTWAGVGAAEQRTHALSEAAALETWWWRWGRCSTGVSEHMREYPPGAVVRGRGATAGRRRPRSSRRAGAEILLNYLPRRQPGRPPSTTARRPVWRAGVSFINCIPVFVVSDPQWAGEFERPSHPDRGRRRPSRSWAPPSSIACWRSCSTTAASCSIVPTS